MIEINRWRNATKEDIDYACTAISNALNLDDRKLSYASLYLSYGFPQSDEDFYVLRRSNSEVLEITNGRGYQEATRGYIIGHNSYGGLEAVQLRNQEIGFENRATILQGVAEPGKSVISGWVALYWENPCAHNTAIIFSKRRGHRVFVPSRVADKFIRKEAKSIIN